jgi:hypothetical protein
MKRLLLLGLLFSLSAPSFSTETEGFLMSCLKHWGNAPFNEKSPFTLLASTAKVFGIGQDIEDLLPTPQPKLYLVDAGPNIMGSSTIRLLNPNGYYCFKNNVNVMGGDDHSGPLSFASCSGRRGGDLWWKGLDGEERDRLWGHSSGSRRLPQVNLILG